ncbi:MAG: hypothetical protein U0R26_08720 [Solirubrobacterales bacterium]
MPPEMRIDLRDDVVVVPEGMYPVKVEEVVLREANSGSNYLKFRFTVVEGEHEDAVLWGIGSLREDMRWALRQTFRALGFDAEDLTIETEAGDGGEEIVVEPDFVGLEALAQVVHDEYLGEVRAKVKRLVPMDKTR